MKKMLEVIWADFDRADPVDVILLCFGYFCLAVILGIGIGDFIHYVR